ncbi:adenylosuccinate synthase [SAR202 cluster bacterium AD-804-J14_MRT_500m]|nr:adenylosuccinate synthase [SAR202 cluster bacterium AD-804-J14_MRT_500m]
MPAYALIGAQWGDEGKGKVVDYLAANADWVVRSAGGNNAGHTVINDAGKFSLHLVPSGIFRTNVRCVIGNGVVVDPEMLLQEINGLSEAGVDTRKIYLSDRAHLIMPYHVLLDQLEEQARGGSALGTTGRGVGPAYVDKVGRAGIRAGDLLDLGELTKRLDQVVKTKNEILTKVYGANPISLQEILEKCARWGEKLKSVITSTEVLLQEALERQERVLMEGAQGSLLDLDHGTYPYVTSSSPSVGGGLTGLGFGPFDIKGVIGVFKAYSTRVGGGPMPTEMKDDKAGMLRERAWEYGTTTGRARRIGWFDAIAGRYIRKVNGFTSLVLTRLDVLDGIGPVKICVGYRANGTIVNNFPASASLLERCEPVFEELPGWDEPSAGATQISQLPDRAVNYVNRLAELVGCPIDLISTGPHRDETIQLKKIM